MLNPSSLLATLVVSLSLSSILALPASAGEDDTTPSTVHAADDWQPPGYYQFFHKTGELERLPAEVQRDDQIAAGARAPEALSGPVPDLTLPDTRGTMHSLTEAASGRRLVIVTFRTWW